MEKEDHTKLNIYAKLQLLRCQLQDKPLKKSGKNSFQGYEYFELGDFIPQVNKLMLELHLTSVIAYTAEFATLTLINCEKPDESINFTSPMSSAALKGSHEVQNLGAVESYLRRYLWMTALELVEHDPVDSSPAKEPVKTKMTQPAIQSDPIATTDQKEALVRLFIEVEGKSPTPEWLGKLTITQVIQTMKALVDKKAKLKEQVSVEDVNKLMEGI